MKRIRTVPILLLLLLIRVGVLADNSSGVTGCDFLRIISFPRNEALGGILSLISNGSAGLFANTGGLHSAQGWEISGMHTEWFESIRLEQAAFSKNLSRNTAFGIGAGFLYTGEMAEISEEKTGAFPGKYIETGRSFTANSAVIMTGFSTALSGNLNLGFTLKYIREMIKDYSIDSYGGDLGAMFTAGDTKAGLLFSNFGSAGNGGSLPSDIRLGISQWLKPVKTALFIEADKSLKENMSARAGVEIKPYERINLRLGYILRLYDPKNEDTGISSGFGINLKGCRIDYSYRPMGLLGQTHRLSITFYKKQSFTKFIRQ